MRKQKQIKGSTKKGQLVTSDTAVMAPISAKKQPKGGGAVVSGFPTNFGAGKTTKTKTKTTKKGARSRKAMY